MYEILQVHYIGITAKLVKMTDSEYHQVYKDFYLKLVHLLPLDDPYFRGVLKDKKLFPGDLHDRVIAEPTKAQKNEYFLHNSIESSLNTTNTSFIALLEAMEQHNDVPLNQLAKEIKEKLNLPLLPPPPPPPSSPDAPHLGKPLQPVSSLKVVYTFIN